MGGHPISRVGEEDKVLCCSKSLLKQRTFNLCVNLFAYTFRQMPAKKNKIDSSTLVGPKLVKEVNRRIRTAMKLWDAHRNAACREERKKAIVLYEKLSDQEKEGVPQELRVWLRYRSEKYFGEGRVGNGANSGSGKPKANKPGEPKQDDDDPLDEWAGVGL